MLESHPPGMIFTESYACRRHSPVRDQCKAHSGEHLHVPLHNWHFLTLANVIGHIEEEQPLGYEYPSHFLPGTAMELTVVLSPLHGTGVPRGKRPAQGAAVGNASASILGIVMVGHAVAIGGRRHDGVEGCICEGERPRVPDQGPGVLRGPLRLQLDAHGPDGDPVSEEGALGRAPFPSKGVDTPHPGEGVENREVPLEVPGLSLE